MLTIKFDTCEKLYYLDFLNEVSTYKITYLTEDFECDKEPRRGNLRVL